MRYEELCRSRGAGGGGPKPLADNTLLDLHNSSFHTQPHPIIVKYYYIRSFWQIWHKFLAIEELKEVGTTREGVRTKVQKQNKQYEQASARLYIYCLQKTLLSCVHLEFNLVV